MTAAVAFYKVKPEAGQIVVTAAQGALIVQTGVIENLQKELKRIQDIHAEEIAQLNKEVQSLKLENQALRLHLDKMERDQARHDGEIKTLNKNGH